MCWNIRLLCSLFHPLVRLAPPHRRIRIRSQTVFTKRFSGHATRFFTFMGKVSGYWRCCFDSLAQQNRLVRAPHFRFGYILSISIWIQNGILHFWNSQNHFQCMNCDLFFSLIVVVIISTVAVVVVIVVIKLHCASICIHIDGCKIPSAPNMFRFTFQKAIATVCILKFAGIIPGLWPKITTNY